MVKTPPPPKTLSSVFPTGKLRNGATVIIPASTPNRTMAEIQAVLTKIANRPKPEKKARAPKKPKVIKTFESAFPTGKLSNGATVIIPASTPNRTMAEIEATLIKITNRPKPEKKARATKPKVVKTFESVFPTGLNKKGTKIVIPISPTRTMEEIMKGPPPKKVAEAIKTIVASVVAPAVAAATQNSTKAKRGKGKKTPLTTDEKKKRASDGRKRRAAEKKNEKK